MLWSPPVADHEAAVAEYFSAHGARGRGALASALRHPRSARAAWLRIGGLPVIDARLGGGAEAQTVRSGLLRTNRIARWMVRGTTAVLAMPERPEEFLVGSSESRRSLRTKYNRASRRGFRVVRPATPDERRDLLAVADAYEREHPDDRYRNDQPSNDYLLGLDTWLVAADEHGKPLLLAVPAISGEWATLQHFKTLESSDDARLARFWMSVELVAVLRGLGVRYLADPFSPIGLPPGLRDFQRRLGYRLFRVRLLQ